MSASSFTNSLLRWYAQNARELPWRKTNDPYKIWISEVMLQQTTVNAVIPFYERWIKLFPNVDAVANAPQQKILSSWQGLGYYQRAKNIQNAAKILRRDFQSQIPSNYDALKTLPGFGPYTIGAVLSIAFGLRYSIIDANVRRFIMRQLALEGPADPSQDEKIKIFLQSVMPQKNMPYFNQALMEMGALICRSQSPLCPLCPVQKSCLAFQKGIQELIPTPKKRELKNIEAVIAILEKDGKFFIQKRPSQGLLADLWEFPGGKVEPGENLAAALKRELKEELNVDLKSANPLVIVHHSYTQFKVKLNVFLCHLTSWPGTTPKHKWVGLKALKNYPMPSGSVKIVEHLQNFPQSAHIKED